MNSKKKIIVRILIACLSLTIMSGVGIMSYFVFNSPSDDVITNLNLTANGSKTVEFDCLSLIPGESREYTVILKSNVAGDYSLSIELNEESDGTLKSFAYAKIEADGEVICDALLAELFSGDPLVLNARLSKKDSVTLKITYYMPIEVGNEAENASADFDMVISACSEEEK